MKRRTAETIEVLLILIIWLVFVCGIAVFGIGVIIRHVPSVLIGLASGIGSFFALNHYVNRGWEFLSIDEGEL